MTQFYDDKGIKREYSVAKTPQQNVVAERRNKTLIEAARTIFIAMDSEAQKSSGKEAQESSTKRTTKSLESDIFKKQNVDENVEPVIDDTEELKKCMEIVPDDRDEIQEGEPVDDMDNLLFRNLKTMFEHLVEDVIWTYQQGLAKVYPLTRNTLHQLWNDVRLQMDYDVKMAYDLLRFIKTQLMEGVQDPFRLGSIAEDHLSLSDTIAIIGLVQKLEWLELDEHVKYDLTYSL
nr:putative ribonuclease H-like domain-containing protein [Tanacetum cinerariifolium]